jgi:RHS repeat-associated protein
LVKSAVEKCDHEVKKRLSSFTFGFNGQEQDNEVSGEGNSYTAEFWQYDSRLGRRFNTDPVIRHYLSGYVTFSNNPIIFVDPLGNTDYYNSKGRKIGTDGIDNGVRKMVLAKSTQKMIKRATRKKQHISMNEKSYEDIVPFRVNLFIAPAKRDKALNHSYARAKKAEKGANGTLVVIEAVSILDAISKVDDATNGGEDDVTTMIFDSHGNYSKSRFKIGSITINDGTGANLEKLGSYLSADASVVLLACHTGGNGVNEKKNKSSLIENLSATMNTTVYAPQSWTGVVNLFGAGNVSQLNPVHWKDKKQPQAWNKLGKWSKSTNGSSPATLNGLRLDNGGNPHEMNSSPVSGASKGVQKVLGK